MPSWIQELLAVFGGITVVACAIAAACWLMFQRFGERWLESKFGGQLERQRHLNAQALEALKSQISAVMDRKLALQKQEFDALQEIWSQLELATGSIQATIVSFRSIPDFTKYDAESIEEFIEQTDLLPWQKREFRKATDKVEFYGRILQAKAIDYANKNYYELQELLSKKGLFLDEQFVTEVRSFADTLRSALSESRIEHRHPTHHFDGKMQSELLEIAQSRIAYFENEVRKRLRAAANQNVA